MGKFKNFLGGDRADITRLKVSRFIIYKFVNTSDHITRLKDSRFIIHKFVNTSDHITRFQGPVRQYCSDIIPSQFSAPEQLLADIFIWLGCGKVLMIRGQI